MKATTEKVDQHTVVLNIEVEPERLATAVDRAYRRLVKTAKIPGFRPGKAPRPIFERFYGKEVLLNDAAESLLPVSYLEAVRELDIEPISRPEFEVVKLEEGSPVAFKARVEVRPEVAVGEYKGLEVERPAVTVTEDDIDREIEQLRNRYAKLVTLEEGRVEKGDLVTIDYEGTVDGQPFAGGEARDRQVEVGMGFLAPELDEGLPGMAIGETKEIRMKLADDYHDPAVAGKEAVLRVTVKGIRRKELAAVDDEFAKDVSEFDTLAELKADIKNKLEETAREQAEAVVRNALVARAAENATVDIPAKMIESALEGMMEEALRPIVQQGLKEEDYFRLTNTSREELADKLRPEAEARVKRELVLDAIAKAEGIKVEDEELDKEIERLAQYYRRDAGQLKETLEKHGELQSLRRGLMRDKAIDVLVANAVVKDAGTTPADET
ncbi:MAG: trigger factor [Thermoanaerobacterales bacterium]|nr:trigger factor [Thermoanaerobacterales bacterium]